MAKSRRSERALRITDDSRLTAPVSSADNISFILGMPNTKIFFHNTVDFDNETGDEIEQTSSIVTVPTLSLLQFCKGALDAFDDKKKDIDALIDEYRANLLDVSSCSAYQEVAPTPKSRKTPKRSID
jgi:hypothetical protein